MPGQPLPPPIVAIFGEACLEPAYGRAVAIRRALDTLGCIVHDATIGHPKSMTWRGPWAKMVYRILQLPGRWRRLWRHWRRLPHGAIVLVLYPGFPDGILAAWLARRTGHPLVLDALVGMHDTIVSDRRLVHAGGFLALAIADVERWVLRRCHTVLVDTPEHAAMFSAWAGVDPSRFTVLPLGVDGKQWAPLPLPGPARPFEVLFWATGIPLHGAGVVAEAARRLADTGGGIHMTIVGIGRGDRAFRDVVTPVAPSTVTWIRRWMPLSEIRRRATAAHCCLGIFGTTAKADRVIPYKVQQALALGRPVITADTRAARRLLAHGRDALLVPPGDPEALAAAIQWLAAHPDAAAHMGENGRRRFEACLSDTVLRHRLETVLEAIAAAPLHLKM